MGRKLVCPKCGEDSFKISLGERQETVDLPSGTRKLVLIQLLHITCSKCGWNKHLAKA